MQEGIQVMRFIKQIGLAFATLVAAASSACAGDAATLNILGFSHDGGIFAFEEYGIQDGSGFPYANRFYIDTATDKFLPGTPVRVRIDDENAALSTVRDQARDQGEKIVKQSELEGNRGYTAGFNPVTQLNGDPYRMAVNPRPVFPAIDDELEFRLVEFPREGPEVCQALGETMGFRLLRIGTRDGAQTRLLHEDETLPQSRNCPIGYRIGGIQTFYGQGAQPVYAVLIAVRSIGFEGPDHRWMAVTGKL